jgi:hypothetical protein
VTLGVRFVPSVSGSIRGVRLYRGADAPFSIPGFPVAIYDGAGTQLATGTATISQNPSSGWLNAALNTSVSVVAGQTYVAAYYAERGRYSVQQNALGRGFAGPKVSAVANGGVYAYGPSLAFPSSTFRASNYFVDVSIAPTP